MFSNVFQLSRRDTIVTRGEAQSKLHKNVVTKGKFQRQLVELRKKIKNAITVSLLVKDINITFLKIWKISYIINTYHFVSRIFRN